MQLQHFNFTLVYLWNFYKFDGKSLKIIGDDHKTTKVLAGKILSSNIALLEIHLLKTN